MIKIIKQFKKPYIFIQILDYIEKNQNKIPLIQYNDSNRQEMFNKLEIEIKTFANNNGINVSSDDNINKRIYNSINKIIQFSKKDLNRNKFREDHLIILNNLLFFKNDQNIISNFDDKNTNEKYFSLNSFILTYTLEAIKFIFNKEFKKDDWLNLFNIYLYLIFQINQPNFIKKIKILTYEYLNNPKYFEKFVLKSSENITSEKNYDDKTLRKFENQFNELHDITTIQVQENVKNFFNGIKVKKEDLLAFFTPKNIKNNFSKITKKDISFESIVIDELKYNEDKIHLFSLEFLISNGFKSKIDLCNLEIFNKDNYSVDLFAKYITEIIEKINDGINKNNFSDNDFIKENLIKFNQMNFLHYISAKLDYEQINKLENKITEKFDCVGINLGDENKNEITDNEDEENKYLNKNDINSSLSSSKLSYSKFKKKTSELLENLINQRLIKNIKKDELIPLPNILFMLNLNIPILNEDNNSMNFKPVHLNFFNQNKNDKINNNYYGCKEIDAIFKNNSKQSYEVSNSEYFYTNLTFEAKNSAKIKFEPLEKQSFNIKPNSILFCEIKNYFPDIRNGIEDVFDIKISIKKRQSKYYYPNELSDLDDSLDDYYEQLVKLIKKFNFFYNTFKDKVNNNEELNIHIVFLYDSYNIDKDEGELDNIKKLTLFALNKYSWRFNNLGNIIFQLVFFDKVELEKSTYKSKNNIIDELYSNPQKISDEIIKIKNNPNLTEGQKKAAIEKLFMK